MKGIFQSLASLLMRMPLTLRIADMMSALLLEIYDKVCLARTLKGKGRKRE